MLLYMFSCPSKSTFIVKRNHLVNFNLPKIFLNQEVIRHLKYIPRNVGCKTVKISFSSLFDGWIGEANWRQLLTIASNAGYLRGFTSANLWDSKVRQFMNVLSWLFGQLMGGWGEGKRERGERESVSLWPGREVQGHCVQEQAGLLLDHPVAGFLLSEF